MKRDEWKQVPQFTAVKVDNYLSSLTSLFNEASGAFVSREPEAMSFDMDAVNALLTDGKSIHKALKELFAKSDA